MEKIYELTENKKLVIFLCLVLAASTIALITLRVSGPKTKKDTQVFKKDTTKMAVADTSESTKDVELELKNYETYSYRDPFMPLGYQVPTPLPPTSSATSSSSSTSGSSSGTSSSASSSSDNSGSTITGYSANTKIETPLATSISNAGGKEKATIQYSGSTYEVSEGNQIANSLYMVLDIDSANSKITYMYGDQKLTFKVGNSYPERQ
ncbi:MAG: hypothetical protein C4562_01470 [Actinobacteria bacterium]|nr:MAG: hypothetical protein C4562_01470 [Actinomycetota bacterium]